MLYTNRVCGRPVTRPEFYRQKIGKKKTISNQYISVYADIDKKWFVMFEHAINYLSFSYIQLPNLNTFFLLQLGIPLKR